MLTIVRLNNAKFTIPSGHALCTGYALKNDNNEYLAFNHDGTPYIPRGGKKALESILAAGGFITFDGMSFVKPIE